MLSIPKSKVILILSGQNLDPALITEKSGLKPDYEQNSSYKDLKGRPMPGKWQLNSRLSAFEELEQHILDILKRISDNRQFFKDIAKDYTAKLYCTIEYSGENTDGYRLSSRTLTILGSLGFELEVDTWKLESKA